MIFRDESEIIIKLLLYTSIGYALQLLSHAILYSAMQHA